ncbi:SDR family NAD(P)-dependent oxidoreductase [Streptomyces sp. 5-8]|uniref:SDR family NAD(P)-dependent oxidoreductase n=1 Tax=Streptomyces musisoli TaxID=2802280 RepID=A0ABS1PBH6_9ACTN|nr:SDR family NAD(P)-dependent oxidoreductase [Streptomyces musisoli]
MARARVLARLRTDPGPGAYSATKAFVPSFWEVLWAEYKKSGVHVLSLCPGMTPTGAEWPCTAATGPPWSAAPATRHRPP